MLWLKRWVEPSLPKEAILIDVVYPAARLAHGRSLRLLLTMVCSLQNGLRELHTEFWKVHTVVDEGGEVLHKTPNSREKLSYTYLMALFVLHYPKLMTILSSEDSAHLPYVERYENSDWTSYYMSVICQFLWSH